ncbi:MAG: hypothetical protein OXH81_03235 [Gemmatimonadetes bacterium]|nr:hypothetical protein [Gemmatimonadota bacterium]
MSWDDEMRLCFSNLWNRLSHVEGEKYLDFNKEYADDLLEKYIHEDGEDRVKGKYHEFSSRFWEMYLVTSFLEDEFCLVEKKTPEGPDIKIKLGDRIIWVEAVVPGPGGEMNNDRVPDLESGVVREVPDKQMKLRLTNAFSEKFSKYKNYRERDLVKEEDDYVIAINGSLIGRSERDVPRIVRILFPIGNPVLHIRMPNNFDQRPEIVERSHEYQGEIVKCEGSKVPTDPFLKDEYAGISAVLYSTCYLFNFDYAGNSNHRRLSRSFTLVHNPKRHLIHTKGASGFLRCRVGYYATSDTKDKNKMVLKHYIDLTKEEEVADVVDQIAKSISYIEAQMTLDSMQNTQKIQNALVQLREYEEEAKKALQETQTIGLESVLITIKEIKKKVESVCSDAGLAIK